MSWKPANKPSRFPDWVPVRLRRWIRRVLKWGLVSLTVVLAVGLFYFYLASGYDLSEVGKMPERSVVLDRHGDEIAAVHGERRRLISRDEIPEAMVQALLAREDARFMEHGGIDMRGLARATVRNVKDMSFTQGASTLTMQLTRNTYELRAKSLHRKLLEMAITLRIEGRYDKNEILTHYLNRIYFGAGCHGVEEAAQTYFGRSVSDLNAGESAMLVGIIRGPHLFSPFRNFEGAMVQRDEVLDRMVFYGFLSEEQKREVMNLPIRLVPKEERNRDSSYVRELIRRQLQVILDKGDIRSGGLRVHTTVDAGVQSRYEALLAAAFADVEGEQVTGLQSAVVSLEPSSGGVLALCGGRNYSLSAFDRAHLARRDLGDGFVPFLTAMALERNKVPIEGQVVQTGRQLGVEETTRLSKRLGFSGPFADNEDLYRGTLATSPVELATAGMTLVSDGEQPRVYVIEKITDMEGAVLYQHQPSVTQVFRRDAAREALQLSGGQGARLLVVTRSRRDAWGMEFGGKRVTVVWLGHDKPQTIGSSAAVRRVLEGLLP